MEPLTLEELVRLCQRTLPDDTRAFERLVAEYKGAVFSIAYRLMNDRHEAEDQAQEVFIKVFRSIQTLEDPVTFPAWLKRITVNTCLDALERQKRRPRVLPLAHPNEDGDVEIDVSNDHLRIPEPELAALSHELRECVEETLRQLSPIERTALVLRDVESHSYQDIAQIMTLGLSAAKMRIHRARLAFQSLFKRLCSDLWQPGQVEA